MMLARHVRESLWRARFRLLAVVLICASSFGISCGAYSAIGALISTVEAIQAESNMADFEIISSAEDAKNIPAIDAVDGVMESHRRLLMTGRLNVPGERTVAALLISAPFQQHREINRVRVLEGQMPDEGDTQTALLERNCATHYGLHIGDEVVLRINTESHRLMVGGIVQSPEYLIAPLNPNAYVPASGSLCVLYADERLMDEALGFRAVNSILVRARNPVDPAFRERLTRVAESRLAVEYVASRDEHYSLRFLELDLNVFRVFMPTVVVIFSVVSALVVYFLMEQWIRRERPLIAMFLTLGYRIGDIVRAYLLPALVVMMLAVALGIPVALFDMWAFGTNYANAIGMPAPALALDLRYLAVSGSITAATVALGVMVPILKLTRVAPLEAMRRTNLAGYQWPAVERVMGMIRLGIGTSYACRNMVRNWATSLLIVLAICATLAVTISFRVANTSMSRMAFNSLLSDQWVAVADFNAPMWQEDIGRLEGAVAGSRWSPVVKGIATIAVQGLSENVHVLGLVTGSGVRRLILLEGRTFSDAEEGVAVLERRIASTHGLRPGDRFEIRAKGRTRTLTMVGVHTSALPAEAVMPLDTAAELLDLEAQMTGAFLISPDPTPSDVSAIASVEGVSGVSSKQEIFRAILDISHHIMKIINTAALVSISVTLLFLLTAASAVISARSAEYATLRMLGHSNRVLARIVLTEVMVLACFGAVLAVPAGALLGYVVNEQLTRVWFKVLTDPSMLDFLLVIAPALVFVPLVSIPIVRKLLRSPLREWISERGPS